MTCRSAAVLVSSSDSDMIRSPRSSLTTSRRLSGIQLDSVTWPDANLSCLAGRIVQHPDVTALQNGELGSVRREAVHGSRQGIERRLAELARRRRRRPAGRRRYRASHCPPECEGPALGCMAALVAPWMTSSGRAAGRADRPQRRDGVRAACATGEVDRRSVRRPERLRCAVLQAASTAPPAGIPGFASSPEHAVDARGIGEAYCRRATRLDSARSGSSSETGVNR